MPGRGTKLEGQGEKGEDYSPLRKTKEFPMVLVLFTIFFFTIGEAVIGLLLLGAIGLWFKGGWDKEGVNPVTEAETALADTYKPRIKTAENGSKLRKKNKDEKTEAAYSGLDVEALPEGYDPEKIYEIVKGLDKELGIKE